MKNLTVIFALILIVFSCGKSEPKTEHQEQDQEQQKEVYNGALKGIEFDTNLSNKTTAELLDLLKKENIKSLIINDSKYSNHMATGIFTLSEVIEIYPTIEEDENKKQKFVNDEVKNNVELQQLLRVLLSKKYDKSQTDIIFKSYKSIKKPFNREADKVAAHLLGF